MKELTALQRLSAPIPKFFKRLRLILLFLGGIIGAIGGILQTYYPNDKMTVIIIAIGGTIATIGTLVSQFAVDFNKLEEQTKEIEDGTPLN